MKSILLTVGLAFIGMYATAQTRVIDYPVMGRCIGVLSGGSFGYGSYP